MASCKCHNMTCIEIERETQMLDPRKKDVKFRLKKETTI